MAWRRISRTWTRRPAGNSAKLVARRRPAGPGPLPAWNGVQLCGLLCGLGPSGTKDSSFTTCAAFSVAAVDHGEDRGKGSKSRHRQNILSCEPSYVCWAESPGGSARDPNDGLTHMNIFLLSCSWHERIIYRASGAKLVLCGHGKGRRDVSAEHFMRWLRRPGPWPGTGAVTLTGFSRYDQSLQFYTLCCWRWQPHRLMYVWGPTSD